MANQNFKVKKGLEVGTALTATSDGLNVTGVVTATQFSGDGSGLTGITAAGSGVVVQEEGSNVGTAATINFIGSNVTAAISSGIANVTVSAGGLSNVVEDTTPQLGGNLDLNSKNITGTGNISITGGFNATGVSTFQEAVTFQSHVSFGDNDKVNFGAGNDLQIYHTGASSFIDNAATGGGLFITQGSYSGRYLSLRAVNNGGAVGDYVLVDTQNQSVELKSHGSTKLTVNTNGSTFTGNVQLSSHLDMPDSAEIRLGTGDDLKIYNNGTHSYIDNVTNGALIIRNTFDDVDVVIESDDGSGGLANYFRADGSAGDAILYHYGTQKFATKSFGVDITGELQCDSLDVDGNADISGAVSFGSTVTFDGKTRLLDDDEFHVGTNGSSGDYKFYRDSSNTRNILYEDISGAEARFISNIAGNTNAAFHFFNGSNALARFSVDNAQLHSGGAVKFETTSTGATVTGTLAATAVTGDGSGLTSLTGASAGTYGASTNTPIITVDSNGRITGISTVATSGAGGGGGISNILEDTTPQLGGNLDLNSKIINGSGNLDYTGNLKVTGISTITGVAGFSSHVTLPDHAQIQVGSATGGDLKIYHDGSNSYVSDAGTGGLKITGGDIYIRNTSDQDMIHASSGSFVKLYHNNVLRLQTTGTGVNITDTLNVAGVSTFTGASTFTGVSNFNNTINVADNVVANFGASSDGRIAYVSSTNRFFVRVPGGSGSLILGAGPAVRITNENGLTDRAVFTSTGVTVTGAVTGTTIVKSGGTSSQYLMADGSVSTTVGISTNSNNIQATWSVTANGSSAYRFTGPGNDGSDNNPDLYLIRGQRYRFANDSGGSHPFQIRSVVGGSAYSAGVTNNGAASGNIEFNVQHDAPSRLFYQCTSHSGMVGNIYITGGGQWQNTSVAASGTPEIYTDYNVGIGTDNPTSNLTIAEDGASTNAEFAINYAGSGNRTSAIRFQRGGTNYGYIAGAAFMLTTGAQDDLAIAPVSGKNLLFGIGNSEALRVDSSKRLVVGADASVQVAGSHPFIQHHGNKTTTNLAIAGYANNLGGSILALGASRSTTVGTPGTIVANNDILGDIRFAGDDGTDINSIAAAIRGEVDGAPGSNDMPGRLVFATTADGAASATERLRIDSSGRILQGLTTAKTGFFNDSNAAPVHQIQGDNYYKTAFSIFRDGAGQSGPNFILAKGREAIVQDDDILGTISFQGHDGTTELVEGAQIQARVDSTPGSNDMPGRLMFLTSSDGSSLPTERLRITSGGDLKLQINSTSGKFTMIEGTTSAFSLDSNGANGYFRLIDEYDSAELVRFHGDGALSINTTSLTNYSQSSNSNNTNNAGGAAGNWSWRRDTGAVIQATDADSGWALMYLNKFEWNSGDDNRWISFYLNGVAKDTITWNGSNVVFGGGSDYRIKKNIRDFTSGIDKVKQLKVHTFDYIETDRGNDHVGFIAHELQEIIPDAVSGEKDGMRKEEETGNDVMDVQMVDYGRVTPVLTAALQEALAKIETLEAKVAALEGS